MIPLTPVTSSNIEALGHDAEANALHVKFKTGDLWIYDGVSLEEHDALLCAKSIGSHFHAHVRGKKEGRKHEPEPKPEAAADRGGSAAV